MASNLFIPTGGGPGSDTTAIHRDTAGEISLITEKGSPVGADLLLIEDSEDSNNKKKIQLNSAVSVDATRIQDTAGTTYIDTDEVADTVKAVGKGGVNISTSNEADAGDIAITAGNSTGVAEGGVVNITGGQGATYANGGAVNITAGQGGNNAGGGAVNITGGVGQSGSTGGDVNIKSGQGGIGNRSGNILLLTGNVNYGDSGAVSIRTQNAPGYTSGNINIQTGTGAARGTITLNAAANGAVLSTQPTGDVDAAIATTKYVDDATADLDSTRINDSADTTYVDTDATADTLDAVGKGAVNIKTANAATAGAVTIQAGNSSGANQAGGDVNVKGGQGGEGSVAAGGDVNVTGGSGGAAYGAPNGGNVNITGGAGNAAESGATGGDVVIKSGTGASLGPPGKIDILAANNTGSATGGKINIVAGNGAYGNGGDVTVRGGRSTSGTPGKAIVEGAKASGSNNGGETIVRGGQNNGSGTKGGRVIVRGGDTDGGNGDSGDILIETTVAPGFTAGDITIQTGYGSNSGNINIKASATGTAGIITLNAAANNTRLTNQPTGAQDNAIATTKYANDRTAVPMVRYIDGTISTGENQKWFRVPFAFDISKVRIGAATAPTGATLIVDINYHATDPDSATTIFTTQANRPSIAAGAHTADSGTPDITSVAAGGWLGISVDQVGSTIAGDDLVIEIFD